MVPNLGVIYSPQGPSVCPFSQHSNFPLPFWCWLLRSNNATADGNQWSSVFRRFENQVFLLVASSISIRTKCFYLDNSPTLSPTLSKLWACLSLHTAVNSCSPKWSIPRVRCVHNYQIITCLVCYLCQPLCLALILHLFCDFKTSDVS